MYLSYKSYLAYKLIKMQIVFAVELFLFRKKLGFIIFHWDFLTLENSFLNFDVPHI